jgi:E3 ubiquitin-protein ligase HUWE1
MQRFLPLVRAFFVAHPVMDAHAMDEEDAAEGETAGGSSGMSPKVAPAGTGPDIGSVASLVGRLSSQQRQVRRRLALFVEQTGELLNGMLRLQPSLLTGELAAVVQLPAARVHLDFDNKRTYFRARMRSLKKRSGSSQHGVQMSIRRTHFFEDSFRALRYRKPNELYAPLSVTFSGEEGVDAGGLRREWFAIMAREMLDPHKALFMPSADGSSSQPNPHSYVNEDHLSYFHLAGRTVGKAVLDGELLDVHFTRSFYKHILGKPVTYHDVESIDPEFYRNLVNVLNMAIDDLYLGLTFSVSVDEFGVQRTVELIPDGENVDVTDANKMQYIDLLTQHKMTHSISGQIDAFLTSFHELVPADTISIFSEAELELLIAGLPKIDLDDLKGNTEYVGFSPHEDVIKWLWDFLMGLNDQDKARFIMFVTGTSKVPLGGFKALQGMRGPQKFNIHRMTGAGDERLPTSSTCFNQLSLVNYSSSAILEKRMLTAIREGSEGFGFA